MGWMNISHGIQMRMYCSAPSVSLDSPGAFVFAPRMGTDFANRWYHKNLAIRKEKQKQGGRARRAAAVSRRCDDHVWHVPREYDAQDIARLTHHAIYLWRLPRDQPSPQRLFGAAPSRDSVYKEKETIRHHVQTSRQEDVAACLSKAATSSTWKQHFVYPATGAQ